MSIASFSMSPTQGAIHKVLPTALEYHRAGMFEQADDLYGKLTADLPNLAQIVHLRGLIAHAKGQYDLAVHYGTQAVAMAPENPEYHNLVGSGYYHAGRFDDAIKSFHHAIAINPNFAEAYANCSLAQQSCGRFTDALESAQKAVELHPNFANGQLVCGIAYIRLGRHADAEGCFRRAVELDPNNIDAWRNLGHCYKEQGRFAAATEAYQRLLSRSPYEGHAIYALSQIRKHTEQDRSWSQHLEQLLTSNVLPSADAQSAHAALGKSYEDLGEYDRAFAHYRQANELGRLQFDRAACAARVDELVGFFTPEWFASHAGYGDETQKPIFIVGMFRSGTSLVEQIISSHSQVYGCGELLDIKRTYADLPALADGTPFPECLNALSPLKVQALANDYLNKRRAQAGEKPRTTDKLPKNFWHLGLISLLFAKAKIIHCVRDPLDTCLSCYTTRFSAPPPYSTDLDDTAFFYQQYARLMEHWRRVLPLPMLEVRYEELVVNPKHETQRMLEFCELPWDNQCLRFFENDRPVQTSSDWQVRQPVFESSVGRWRRFAPHLGKLISALGLEPN